MPGTAFIVFVCFHRRRRSVLPWIWRCLKHVVTF